MEPCLRGFPPPTGVKMLNRKTMITSKADWYRERRRLRSRLIKLLGGFPPKCPLKARLIKREDMGTYIREKISFKSEPGEVVPSYMLIPKELSSPSPALLCPNPHGGRFALGKDGVVGLRKFKGWDYGLDLVKKGYIVLAPDAKCFGERRAIKNLSGMWEERFVATAEILKGKTLARRMILDLKRAIDYMETRPEIDSDRIGCIGFSMGAGLALFVSALDERIKVAVSMLGVTTYKAIMKHQRVHCMLYYIPGILKHMDFPEIVSLVAARPYLIINGKLDSDMPLEGLREVTTQARKVYRLLGKRQAFRVHITNSGHVCNREVRKLAYKWLERWL